MNEFVYSPLVTGAEVADNTNATRGAVQLLVRSSQPRYAVSPSAITTPEIWILPSTTLCVATRIPKPPEDR